MTDLKTLRRRRGQLKRRAREEQEQLIKFLTWNATPRQQTIECFIKPAKMKVEEYIHKIAAVQREIEEQELDAAGE